MDLDKAIRPLVLIMPKMSDVKTFKVKDGDKDKTINWWLSG